MAPRLERPSAPPAGAGHYVAAVTVGILLAVVIGVGGFYGWRKRHARVAEAAPTAVVPVPVPVGGAAPSAPATAPSVEPQGTVSADIVFKIVPSDATLSVDGRALAADVRTVPRPAVGTTVAIVARAKGFEDLTILVDFFTTSPMELTLKAAVASGPTVTGPAPPSLDEPKDPAKDPPKRRLAPRDPALPPNPF